MRTRTLLVLAVGLTVAGCTTPTADPVATDTLKPVPAASAPTTSSATPSPSPSPSPTSIFGERVLNDRGNVVKTIGQLAGFTAADDDTKPVATFTVTAIEPDFKCTSQYAEAPKNGHFVAVTMDIQTAPELAAEDVNTLYFSEYDFKIFSPEGTRENDSTGNAYLCLDEGDKVPSEVGPGEHVTGMIVLDTAHVTGGLVLAPSFMGGTNGWEWAY